MCLPEQYLELVSVFKDASRNYIFLYFFYRHSIRIDKPFAHVLICLKKNIQLCFPLKISEKLKSTEWAKKEFIKA